MDCKGTKIRFPYLLLEHLSWNDASLYYHICPVCKSFVTFWSCIWVAFLYPSFVLAQLQNNFYSARAIVCLKKLISPENILQLHVIAGKFRSDLATGTSTAPRMGTHFTTTIFACRNPFLISFWNVRSFLGNVIGRPQDAHFLQLERVT